MTTPTIWRFDWPSGISMYYVQNHGYVETISPLSNAAVVLFTHDDFLPFIFC